MSFYTLKKNEEISGVLVILMLDTQKFRPTIVVLSKYPNKLSEKGQKQNLIEQYTNTFDVERQYQKLITGNNTQVKVVVLIHFFDNSIFDYVHGSQNLRICSCEELS